MEKWQGQALVSGTALPKGVAYTPRREGRSLPNKQENTQRGHCMYELKVAIARVRTRLSQAQARHKSRLK